MEIIPFSSFLHALYSQSYRPVWGTGPTFYRHIQGSVDWG